MISSELKGEAVLIEEKKPPAKSWMEALRKTAESLRLPLQSCLGDAIGWQPEELEIACISASISLCLTQRSGGRAKDIDALFWTCPMRITVAGTSHTSPALSHLRHGGIALLYEHPSGA